MGWPEDRISTGSLRENLGDIVDLQYFLYKEDVARVAALGVNAHSFSYVVLVAVAEYPRRNDYTEFHGRGSFHLERLIPL